MPLGLPIRRPANARGLSDIAGRVEWSIWDRITRRNATPTRLDLAWRSHRGGPAFCGSFRIRAPLNAGSVVWTG
jgi:hypothetical protein